MPRKSTKAAKSATGPPFTGCVVAVSGTFPGRSQGQIAQLITDNGGTFVKSVIQSCTHLVVTAADIEKQTSKVKAALANNIHVVALSWLDESAADGCKASELDHTAAPTTSSAQSHSSRKRSPSPSSPGSIQLGPKKKAKTLAGHPAQPAVPVAQTSSAKANVACGTRHPHVPQDEGVNSPTHQVYVAPDGNIFDASLNQTNVGNNNNKFYRIQVLHQPSTGAAFTWTRWGRVGDFGQTATLGHGRLADAIREFEKKFRDKTGLPWDDRTSNARPKKYTYLERSYDDDEDDDEDENMQNGAVTDGAVKRGEMKNNEPAPSTLDPATQDLIKLIFNQDYFKEAMKEMNYDVNKLPLGKLSKSTINRGYQALKDLSEVLDDPTVATDRYDMHFAAATEHLSNTYYSLIPHVFGRNRPPLISTNAMLKREIELLESLSDMKDAAQILKAEIENNDIHPLDRQFQGLGLDEMSPLLPDSTEFAELQAYLCQSVGATHGLRYEVSSIFRIQRHGEPDRLISHLDEESRDRRLLWHGSRCTNFAGILSQGLRIAPPEAPVSGYMFGKGIYLADMSSKSANYCAAYASNGHALLLLCEAELGRPMQTLTHADYAAGDNAKSKGMLSTWGQGSTGPGQWKDAGCVHESLRGVMMPDMAVPPGPTNVAGASLLYNEYIVYDVAQVRLRYLLRVKL